MFRKTLRTATLAVAAVAAMSMMAAESSAQCPYGGGGFNRGIGGFGGTGVSIAVGRSNFGGFNNGFNSFGINSLNRGYSGYRGGSIYSPSRHYGRGGFNSFGRSGFRY